MDQELFQLAELLGERLKAKGQKIAVAESCTGGLICKMLTDVPGSSAWFDRGFITYSNEAKMDMLGVKSETLEKYGAVSEQTALEMVQGALKNSLADYAIAVTGIAGPGGGTVEKPVGLVYIASQWKQEKAICNRNYFSGDRELVRDKTLKTALSF